MNFHYLFVLFDCLINRLFTPLYYFFKFSINIQAKALIFELNKAVYRIFMKFKYESCSPLNEWDINKKNVSYFYIHFTNFEANVCSFSLHTREYWLHIWDPSPILIENQSFDSSRLQDMIQQIKYQLNVTFFAVANLTIVFVEFFFTPKKTNVFAKNEWQYCGAKTFIFTQKCSCNSLREGLITGNCT